MSKIKVIGKVSRKDLRDRQKRSKDIRRNEDLKHRPFAIALKGVIGGRV